MLNIHGHTHHALGMTRVGKTFILNPGSLRYDLLLSLSSFSLLFLLLSLLFLLGYFIYILFIYLYFRTGHFGILSLRRLPAGRWQVNGAEFHRV